jgi:hypothetical protein
MTPDPAAPRAAQHPLPAMTTYELRNYRCELVHAISRTDPAAPIQASLRARLDAVIAEQDDRAGIAHA